MVSAREYWNGRSQDYDERIGAVYDEAYRRTVHCICRYLSPADRVLDFGCGTGIVTLPVAQCVSEVWAVDVSDEMVRRLREKAEKEGTENITVSQAGLFDGELRPDSFDAVLACNVLLYLENRAEVLARIRELLRPGGMFLSVTDCLGEGFTRERLGKWWRRCMGRMPYVAFDTVRTLEASVASAGFEVIETENLFPAPPNLFLAARKA